MCTRTKWQLRVDSSLLGDLDRPGRYRRSVPVTTMSTLRLPHREQTSRSRHSARSGAPTSAEEGRLLTFA
jgi:hypothetical protein